MRELIQQAIQTSTALLYTDKQPADLTDEERFFIAIAAGCTTETAWEGAKLVLRLAFPIGIQKIDGRWIVAEKRS